MGDSKKEASVLCGGLDEVGRGSLAGPLCVVVIAFPKGRLSIEGVRDSKKLSKKKREELAPIILKECSFFGQGWASPSFIDEHGISTAWTCACLDALKGAPENMLLIVDGIDYVRGYKGDQKPVIKADDKHWQVSAASIVAKVIRDRYMTEISEEHLDYLWFKNSGYGTKEHREKILELGPTPYHRMSFLKKLLKS